MEKNKKLIFHLQKNVQDVMDMVLNQDLNPVSCSHVEDKVKLDLVKVFLQFNKLVLNVAGSGEQISNPCKECRGNGKKQTKKKICTNIPKVLMMEQELDYQAKEKRV